MKRMLVFVFALALVPAAFATTARDRQAAGPLGTVAVAGLEVAYADEYSRDCHEVRLWDIGTRADKRLASHCFAQTSTGSGVGGAIATGGRALWLTFTGGNIREWSLWTRTFATSPKRINLLSADVDGPPPVVLGHVWEGSLPYALGRTVIVLAPNGSRRFTLTAPDRVVTLSAHSRGYAAVLANGHVLAISPTGQVVRDWPYAARVAQDAVFTAIGLIVKTPAGLEIRNGDTIRQVSLPRDSRFLGFSNGIVAYGLGGQLRLKRITGGNDRLLRTLAPRFQAQLGRRGIAFASGRTFGFNAWAIVSASV